MPATANAYSTTPLKSGSPETRLLELLPGLETSPIFGKLSRLNLDVDKHVNPPYDALSYMWGTTNGARTIHLNQDDNFKVTRNLAAALHALRLRDQPRLIWIDAICINQNNLQERSDQVQLMRKIYQNAATVYVWLDVEVDPNNPALRKLLTFDDRSTDDDLGSDASFWEPLKPIFKNPYWMRVWIQQEVSNAANLAIQCRNVVLPSFNVYHFLRLASGRIPAVDVNTPIWIDWLDVYPNVSLPSRFGFPDSQHRPLQGSTLSDRDLNLMEILAASHKLECTDDRDRLYGILYLAHDYSEGDLTISYDYSVKDTYTSVADFVLRKYNSLNFLLYAGLNWRCPHRERTVPSWVPDWRDPSTRIWISDWPKSENKLRPFMSRFKPSFSADRSTLNAYGICLTRIDQIFNLPDGVELYNTPTSVFLDSCRSIVRKARSNQVRTGLESDIADDFDLPQWHALASALTAVDNFKPEDDYAHSKLKQGITMSADALVKFSRISETKPGERVSTMLDIIRMDKQSGGIFDNGTMFTRLAWGVIGKHLPFVGANGGIGVTLKSADAGDEVWMIFGCDKPMIIRPVDDYFLVIGEGYYDGVNRGELMKDMPESLEVGDMIGGYRVEALRLR
ncbi:hypothetical protein DL765_000202 [Monosporascus sp. GIB2]|nr:hypothetical protein DL765_000202 [Monosporascus sp. GIB2]